MSKQRNDNKDGERGNYYRTLVAIRYIFELRNYEKITIEHKGDVTFDDTIQIEVKHHKRANSLGDNHKDFWNTLYNWKKYSFNFKRLIFHTTSHLKKNGKSIFENWENLSGEQRYNKLKILNPHKVTQKKNTFEYYWNETIGNSDKEEMISLLEKVELKLNNKQDELYLDELSKEPYFTLIQNGKKEFIKQLVKEITDLLIGDKRWETTKKGFQNSIFKLAAEFIKAPVNNLFNKYEDLEPDTNEVASYYNRKFVKEISIIGCEYDEIDTAIIDVWKTNSLLIKSQQIDPLFKNEYKQYKNKKVFGKLINSQRLLEKKENEENNKRISLKFYREAKLWQIDYKSIKSDYDYFLHGTMHSVVEDKVLNFRWLIK